MVAALRYLGAASGIVALANAHTLMTTLFIDGKDQGDGVCVRMDSSGDTAVNPIASLSSSDMACGRKGTSAVAFTCSAGQGSKLTFWWRAFPDWASTGSIDKSHMGPCAVYLKQTSNMASEGATGSGWFKIWEEGYNSATGKWCTEHLIQNQGFLSVNLPTGLPEGDYLVRTELLALHESTNNDPQFYVDCAQVHVTGSNSGTLEIPKGYEATIPGYVSLGSTGLKWDVWNKKGDGYVTPGPPVYYPSASSSSSGRLQAADASYKTGMDSCLVVNGGWCGVEVASYTTESGCWAASENCWNQGGVCYDKAPPSGFKNCDVWSAKCQAIQDACSAGRFTGPPNKGAKLTRVDIKVPSDVTFDAWAGSGASETSAQYGKGTNAEASVTAATDENVDSTAAVEAIQEDTAATTAAAQPEETQTQGYENNDETETEDKTTTTATASEQSSTSGLKVSEDGRCGSSTGQTCEGSKFGNCCSKNGYCGTTRRHCSCGCLGGFGQCNPAKSSKSRVFDQWNEDY